jgi:type III restriction enzyme
MDHPSYVHDINVLTVVASESYKDFVDALQKDISDSLSARPRVADKAYFTDKVLNTPTGPVTVSADQAAGIEDYLVQNGYVDRKRQITEKYHQAKNDGTLASLPEDVQEHAEQVFQLIDSVFSESQMTQPEDGRKSKTLEPNANFQKQEFKELWQRINRKAAYTVQFDTHELVSKSIKALNHLNVTPLQYTIQRGEQSDQISFDGIKTGNAFEIRSTETEQSKLSIHSAVKYDLIGKLAEGTQLTRRTVADILGGMEPAVFDQFKTNPENFLAEAVRLINEEKAAVIIEHIAYDPVQDKFDLDIFTAGQTQKDLSKAGKKLQHHIYDYALTDSDVERDFVEELDTCTDIAVYAKLPRGFLIPTPVGDYNPDWAIAFKHGAVKHVYFVAETKGSLSSMRLREIEQAKIECARKFFERINQTATDQRVKYDVVDSFEKLMSIVK